MNELKRLSNQLTGLLSDPHPGIMAWRAALSDCLVRLAELSGEASVIEAAKAVLRARETNRKMLMHRSIDVSKAD